LKRAGILYVFPTFQTAQMGQKIRRKPKLPLCGVALRKSKELTARNCLTDGEERTIMGTMVFIGKRKLEETP